MTIQPQYKGRFMKKAILLLLLLPLTVSATERRVSFLFMHRSVGLQAVTNCGGPSGPRNIRAVLDTMTVTSGQDTARIVFRDYNLNYFLGDTCLSDTIHFSGCGQDYLQSFRGYNWENSDREKIIHFAPGGYSDMLMNVFQQAGRQDSAYWNVFREHTVPYGGGGNALEKYDLVMVKNPYIIWKAPTQARVDAAKSFYMAVRDTIANHPEINFCFVFGTPLALNTSGGDDFGGDTLAARLIYQLAQWFDSDAFFRRDNNGPYRNLWKLNTYTSLCETSPDSPNRYCLKTAYWAGSGAQSHLSNLGAEVMQDTLIAFVRRATADIMGVPPGRPTRADIDRKIKEFREGRASEQEVLDLIQQYNRGR